MLLVDFGLFSVIGRIISLKLPLLFSFAIGVGFFVILLISSLDLAFLNNMPPNLNCSWLVF